MKLIELTKVCTTCGERKNWKKFNKQKNGRFGIGSLCKACKIFYIKKYRKKNKEKIRISCKKYQEINKKIITDYGKTYYKVNKEKILYNCKRNREINKILKKGNPKRTKSQLKKYYCKQKSKPNFKLNRSMRNGINKSLKNENGKNGKSWLNLVPYTLDDLINCLKKTLPNGYKWNDYANGKTDLHIDHIIPISAHNFKSHTDIDFQRCWALKNLRLLSAFENISKGAKLTKPFQPSLLL